MTGTASTMIDARREAYNRVKNVMIPNMFYRTDIGERWVRDGDLLQSCKFCPVQSPGLRPPAPPDPRSGFRRRRVVHNLCARDARRVEPQVAGGATMRGSRRTFAKVGLSLGVPGSGAEPLVAPPPADGKAPPVGPPRSR